ncbi:MAG: leucyl/phenylalanyl-tRNA--protein transferase [Pseudomonadota bacterium]
MPLYRLDPADIRFPDPNEALTEPNGLLAIGGDLSPVRMLEGYRHGIFPWYSPDDPILWWSPDPRTVLFPDELKIHRSLRKTLRHKPFEIRIDSDFVGTLDGCAAPRPGQQGTWITPDMRQAYQRLHSMGYARSVECWQQGQLVGGLYGVRLGRIFCGESMFSRVSDASKIALVALCHGALDMIPAVIDCQFSTAHLESLGARPIPRAEFLRLLELYSA